MQIGNKLRKIRELHNYTLEHVALLINVSTSQYSKYETDKTPVTFDTIEKIATVYKISLLELLSWDEKNIFNFLNNHVANGIVNNQEVKDVEGYKDLVNQLKAENSFLKIENEKLWGLIQNMKM